jgi:hypothetical protein
MLLETGNWSIWLLDHQGPAEQRPTGGMGCSEVLPTTLAFVTKLLNMPPVHNRYVEK